MIKNISKYVSLTDFLLLEYEFNKDDETINLSDESITPKVANTSAGHVQYFNEGGIGVTNNTLKLNSVATNRKKSDWYINPDNPSSSYEYFDSSTSISNVNYPHDTIKLHIISGYNFDDIGGFLLQVNAKDTSGNLVTLSNFTWLNQVLGSDVLKFSSNSLHIGERFFDKYVEFKIPSVQNLGGDTTSNIGSTLNIQQLSDVYISYSTIPAVDNNRYVLSEIMEVQLPVTSPADNFNAFIAESTEGDYIEYYATWKDKIIGEYMADIESGRIRLYTSNNPNDNYDKFIEQYGVGTPKWVVNHEMFVYEQLPSQDGGTSILTQKFMFTQEDNFNQPNYFRPVLENADVAASYAIDYICRLTNRMDGTQIIRKASFASTDPKKYGRNFTRLNVDNIIPYNVFNKIETERQIEATTSEISKKSYVKIFYDSTNVVLKDNNTVFPQGTGPLFLKKGDSIYKFKFERINEDKEPPQRDNVDLSGAYDYELVFELDNDDEIRVPPTYSQNMTASLGELEFKLKSKHVKKLLKQDNNSYSIVIKNPNGSEYVFYEGLFYSNRNYDQRISQYQQLYNITDLNEQIANLQEENEELKDEIETLKSN
ncbi:MAG: hypothetical protein ACOCZ5_00975 [bacterium]